MIYSSFDEECIAEKFKSQHVFFTIIYRPIYFFAQLFKSLFTLLLLLILVFAYRF